MHYLDLIRGSLFAGAVGDSLGLPLKYIDSLAELNTIASENLSLINSSALVSVNTQLILFTLDGLINTKNNDYSTYLYDSYRHWYNTQNQGHLATMYPSRLKDNLKLHQVRAPGATCLKSLKLNIPGEIGFPLNNSKGCGAVVRCAPIALMVENYSLACQIAMENAALTHSHPLGYLTAGFLSYLLNRLTYEQLSLKIIIEQGIEYFQSLDISLKLYLEQLIELIKLACKLSENDLSDQVNLQQLGLGWTAEEALAIAIYSCLRYPTKIKDSLMCSINHLGNSDACGSICGNIMGCLIGFDNLSKQYNLNDLEIYTELNELINLGIEKYQLK